MSDAVNLGLQLAHALEALRQLEIEWDEAKRDHKDRAERLQQEVNRIKLDILTGQKGLFTEVPAAPTLPTLEIPEHPTYEQVATILREQIAKQEAMPPSLTESPHEVSSDSQPDSLYPEAVQCVLEAGKGSTTLLQKKFSIGYGRATRLIDRMEEEGIVGPADGVNPRAILKRPESSSDGEQATV